MSTQLNFSLIVPVYNRPEEVEELLESLAKQTDKDFEVLMIEDGSSLPCKDVCEKYSNELNIIYHFKPNSGPGPSRNFGMEQANGNYFIIFDSDCLIPPQYLENVRKELGLKYVDCFGGPDAAHPSFSDTQKSINYVMTSFLTTGGIRGGNEALGKFQPRSFNMGISKEVYLKVGGYGKIHPGEDPDLSFRIWNAGFKTTLIKNAFVYHKRRIDFPKFSKQVYKFGVVRVILNKWHPGTSKITYWFPTVFSLVFSLLIVGGVQFPIFTFLALAYLVLLFGDCLLRTKSVIIALGAVFAALIQFYSYGWGFIKAQWVINIQKKDERLALPEFFFK